MQTTVKRPAVGPNTQRRGSQLTQYLDKCPRTPTTDASPGPNTGTMTIKRKILLTKKL
ncbi:MAG: hypothetical protein ACYSW7_07110 [Planctomycetota bacterium]